MEEFVVLVNEKDEEIGTMEKMEVHVQGKLHRAFSILLFNSEGQMLIQKRAQEKYHSAGLWTNTCCSHPRPAEDILEAGARRLKEEMGIDLKPRLAYKFIYRADFINNLVEYEYDYVLTGEFEGEPLVNPGEVEDWKYVGLEDLRKDIQIHPQNYTVWFKLILAHEHFAKKSF